MSDSEFLRGLKICINNFLIIFVLERNQVYQNILPGFKTGAVECQQIETESIEQL